MENTNNENARKITVDIQGETDWVRFTYTTTELDSLKNPTQDLGLLGFKLGNLLDGDQFFELSEEKKSKVSELLAKYVANLKNYQIMLSGGYQSMMITVFKVKNGNATGYAIRVAGILSEDLNEVTVFLDGIPEPLHGRHFLLLNLMNKSSTLYTEKYDKKSAFHDFMSQAKQIGGKIEFRNQADPSLQ